VVTKDSRVLFSTGSQGENADLHVQDDGNLTIRTPDGTVVWALSDVRREKSVLRSGQTLKSGEERRSLNGKIQLRMQGDGNLVLVNPAKEVLFHTATAPNAGAVATMRTDGSLVVTKDSRVLFSTGSQGENADLHVQDDGNLTIRTPDGTVVWASRP
jgi:GTPase involved in cell partitioning and DNA repair